MIVKFQLETNQIEINSNHLADWKLVHFERNEKMRGKGKRVCVDFIE